MHFPRAHLCESVSHMAGSTISHQPIVSETPLRLGYDKLGVFIEYLLIRFLEWDFLPIFLFGVGTPSWQRGSQEHRRG